MGRPVEMNVDRDGAQMDLGSNQKSDRLQIWTPLAFLRMRTVLKGHGALMGLWGAPWMTWMISARLNDVLRLNVGRCCRGACGHGSDVPRGHTHPGAIGPLQEAHHNHGRCVSHRGGSSRMSDHSVANWSVASQTNPFLLGPDGRLWKPKADHSQSPCRLETAACRLREGRRQEEEDQPHAKEKNKREKTQKERQTIKIKFGHPCRIHCTSLPHITSQYKPIIIKETLQNWHFQ